MEETRPKVLALYEAVLELLDEGADINTLKVSDMTVRAGIGKGTAYDYFKSKEEIIAAAVVFDVERKVKTERMRLEQYADFESKVRYCFWWTLQELQEQKAFMRFLYLSSYSCSLKRQIFEELKKRRGGKLRTDTDTAGAFPGRKRGRSRYVRNFRRMQLRI